MRVCSITFTGAWSCFGSLKKPRQNTNTPYVRDRNVKYPSGVLPLKSGGSKRYLPPLPLSGPGKPTSPHQTLPPIFPSEQIGRWKKSLRMPWRRSEERRVGKGCMSREVAEDDKK